MGFDTHDARVSSDGATGSALVQTQSPGFQYAAMVSVPITATAGNLVIVAGYWDQAPNTITLTDTAGFAWTPLARDEIPSGCGGTTGNATGAQLWYARVPADVTNTITIAQTSGTQPLGEHVLEYAGLTTIDATSDQIAPASSTTAFVSPLTTTGADLVVVLFNDTVGNGLWVPGAGYTLRAQDVPFTNLVEDAIVPPGTYMPGATLPVGHDDACWVGTAAAFHTD